MSEKNASRRAARDEALQHARKQFVEYLGTRVESHTKRVQTYTGRSSDIKDPILVELTKAEGKSDGIAALVMQDQIYEERFWEKSTKREYWQIYILAKAVPHTVEENIRSKYQGKIADLESQLKGGTGDQDSLRSQLEEFKKLEQQVDSLF